MLESKIQTLSWYNRVKRRNEAYDLSYLGFIIKYKKLLNNHKDKKSSRSQSVPNIQKAKNNYNKYYINPELRYTQKIDNPREDIKIIKN
jgi:hypothetical protein